MYRGEKKNKTYGSVFFKKTNHKKVKILALLLTSANSSWKKERKVMSVVWALTGV